MVRTAVPLLSRQMAGKGILACNPFREVCCSNSAAEHSDVPWMRKTEPFGTSIARLGLLCPVLELVALFGFPSLSLDPEKGGLPLFV